MNKSPRLENLTTLCLTFGILLSWSITAQTSTEGIAEDAKNYFVENKGQIVDQFGQVNNEVLYLLNTNGLNVQLKRDGFSYDFYTKDVIQSDYAPVMQSNFGKDSLPPKSSLYKFHRLDIQFINSNCDLSFKTSKVAGNKFNYYNTNSAHIFNGVESFKKIYYKNLYPNIDLEFYVPADQTKPVEYNFIIHPKGKISDIRMRFSGAKAKYHEEYLTFTMSMGKMKETIPLSWVKNDGKKENVEVSFDQIEPNIFGFTLKNSAHDPVGTLTIDPTPVRLWSTYFGGEGEEAQYNGDLATDSNGNVFISGYTTSFNNVATAGSFQTTYTNESQNGYLAKFQPNGTLEWATYYGEKRTLFRSITVDSNDDIIGVGETYSAVNIGTTGTHQSQLNNHSDNYFDGFIVKFDTNGNRQWGTYFGGESFDYCTGVSTDLNNNIYVGGHTASNSSIATPGAFRNTGTLNVHGNWDPFLLKLNSNGQRVWSTYYGGQHSNGVDVDSAGNVYLTGSVQKYPDEDIATTGSYQENYSDEGSLSWYDAFLVKFNPNGARLWGTYYGGDSYDHGLGVTVDDDDNVIICGSTRSNIFPTTENAHQRIKTAEYYDYNAFLAKFSTNGTIIWNTLYGGEDGTSGLGVDVDANNNVYLTGGTLSFNDIATIDSYQETKTTASNPVLSNTNAYVVKFDSGGTRLWGTYFGGNHWQEGLSIEVDPVGDLYLLGYTFGSTNLATPGAYQENFNGLLDNFLVKFKDCESSIITEVPSGVCEGDDIVLAASGGLSYQWTGPNGFTSSDANPTITNAAQINSGIYSVVILAADGCDDTRTFEIDVSVRPTVGAIPDLIGCADETNPNFSSLFDTTTIQQQATDGQTGVVLSYFDGAGTPLPSPLQNPMLNGIADTETITVRVARETNPECYVETTFDLIVAPNPIAFTVADMILCDDDDDGIAVFDLSTVESTLLQNQIGMEVSFFDQSGDLLPGSSPTAFSNSQPHKETIRARVTNTTTGCFSETHFNLIVNEIPHAYAVNEIFGCDENNDGFANNFDTSAIIDSVLNGQVDMEVTFYDESGTSLPSPLPNPYTNSIADLETIVIRVTNPESGCYAETELIMRASGKPDIEQPQDRFSCNDGMGIGSFDIQAIAEELIGGKSGLSISFVDSLGNQIQNSLTNYVSASQTITIRVENIGNVACFTELNLNLIVNDLAKIDLDATYALCALEPNIELQISNEYETYQWYNEEGTLLSVTSMATISEEGFYTVNTSRTQNDLVCHYSHTFNLVRSELPVINEVLFKKFSTDFIEIIASGDGDFEFSIDGEIYQDSNYFSGVLGGVYTVHVRDKYNCGADSREITILDYPKFFTPNSDNINDFWQIQGIESYPNATVFIYDRYGKLVTQLNSEDVGWNGEYNGGQLPSSDYWFIVNLQGAERFSGHFSLKR